ncbi:hypothetical protein [Chelativorans sp.]|uniref:hypothetical protein n=1 Tax=Chelativorans sp. TaxID=2203393 RepID=UPI0028117170|nr:hypothetical protein [Chelativorans sp.]
MVDAAIALFGTTSTSPERRELRAGPVTAIFEDGGLRWIKFAGTEVLRAVSFLIRDSAWGTANPQISNLRIDQQEEQFSVHFDVRCRTKDGAIDWRGEIEGALDGRIRFSAVARPEQDFLTCRTGFVVLHPLEGVASRPVTVGYVDGTSEQSSFPEFIAPYQNFKNIRSLTIELPPGISATCMMEGDAWEMEDHRNWTDASFKTYVRLLEWGFPYVVKAGDELRQSVTLTFSGAARGSRAAALPRQPYPVTLRQDGPDQWKMPRIGLSLPRGRLNEAQSVAELIRQVRPAFLHCRLDPSAGEGSELLTRYRDTAALIGSPMALEITVSNGKEPRAELEGVARALERANIEPEAVVAVPAKPLLQMNPVGEADRAAIARIPEAARGVFSNVLVGGGVFGFFAELNRNMPPAAPLDFVTHLTSALVHHSDDDSVMETLSTIEAVIKSASMLSGGKPHWLGPANIGLDDNPYGPATPNPDNGRYTMARMDPRQRGVFAAAWSLGYIAAAARAGVERLIMGAPAGELGIAYASTEYDQPYFDHMPDAAVYPLYHVLREASRAAGAPGLGIVPDDPQRIAALAYGGEGGLVLWAANLTASPQTVVLPEGFSGGGIRMLDQESFAEAVGDPGYFQRDDDPPAGSSIALKPYAVMRVRAIISGGSRPV